MTATDALPNERADRANILIVDDRPEKILVYKGPNDLDKMMNDLLLAWAKLGDGKSKEALKLISRMEGPEWLAIFKNYHAVALAAAAGDKATARARLNEAILDDYPWSGPQLHLSMVPQAVGG